jgi:predicted P-loop ATPase
MGNYQPIILSGKIKKEKENGGNGHGSALDAKMEDYMPSARQLLVEAKDSIEAQSDAIVEIVRTMMAYRKPVQMTRFIDVLTKEFKLKKTDFNYAVKTIIEEDRDNERDDETEGTESSPVISRVEGYIDKRYDIFFNIVSNKFMYKEKDSAEYQEMNLDNIYRELKKTHINYSLSDLKSLMKSDFTEKKNVFIEYFQNLPAWDGVDYIEKLSKYITLVESPILKYNTKERFEHQFKKMFVRCVACSLEVAFNKQCFTIVQEEQHTGKTTFLRWLCPPALQDYYVENIGTGKDDLIALTENFIVNMDELSTLTKYDINALKSVISKHRVKVRLPYGERPEILHRRCNFVASTNKVEFLNDETGNVRWVCFSVERIDWDYMKDIDINKVWAQAYHLFKNTEFVYELTPQEVKDNEEANKSFLIRTPEMELIQIFLMPSTKIEFEKQISNENEIFFMTATEIVAYLQDKNTTNIKLNNVQVGKSLVMLGFVRENKFIEEMKFTVKGYYVQYRKDKPMYLKTDEIGKEPF